MPVVRLVDVELPSFGIPRHPTSVPTSLYSDASAVVPKSDMAGSMSS